MYTNFACTHTKYGKSFILLVRCITTTYEYGVTSTSQNVLKILVRSHRRRRWWVIHTHTHTPTQITFCSFFRRRRRLRFGLRTLPYVCNMYDSHQKHSNALCQREGKPKMSKSTRHWLLHFAFGEFVTRIITNKRRSHCASVVCDYMPLWNRRAPPIASPSSQLQSSQQSIWVRATNMVHRSRIHQMRLVDFCCSKAHAVRQTRIHIGWSRNFCLSLFSVPTFICWMMITSLIKILTKFQIVDCAVGGGTFTVDFLYLIKSLWVLIKPREVLSGSNNLIAFQAKRQN